MQSHAESAFFVDGSDVAMRCIWKVMNGKSQCSLAKVVAINASPISVNIQPLVNYFDQIGGFRAYPVLQNVPVAQNQTASYSIKTPLNIGDTGIVLWFDREVYTNLLAGASSTSSPNSGDLSDQNACVFLPMLPAFSLANPLKPNGVDFVSSQISLMTELSTLLSQLNTFMSDMNTFLQAIVTAGAAATNPLTPVYSSALSAAATSFETPLALIITQLNTVTTDLTTFKGSQ